MANVPEDLHYSKDHEWVRVEGDSAVIGITDYAQDSLGDVVYVELAMRAKCPLATQDQAQKIVANALNIECL